MATATLIFLLLASCSTGMAEPAIRFGGGLGRPYDGPGLGHLATAERWLEVLEPAEEFSDGALIETNRTVVVQIPVAPVRSVSSIGNPKTEAVAIHVSYFPGIDRALATGGRAFLAMAEEGLEREMVSYVVIRTAAGGHFFAGGGAFETLTDPARRSLDDRYDRTMDELIGLTSQDEIARIVGIA